MTSNLTHIQALSQLATAGQPFAVVTMVESLGSAPQDVGTKMLVGQSGLLHGSVGGGKLEFRAIQYAQHMLDDHQRNRELVDWNLQREIGMTCGGIVKLFFEIYNRDDWHVVVFGAGHVAQSLIQVLLLLDCRITCVDSRQEWIGRMPDHARLTRVCVDEPATIAAKLSPNDFVVCMTMGHSTDRPILATIFKHRIGLAYLGVIGSRSKRGALLRELVSDGIDPQTASQFLCPIGLPIGSNQPAEIAISIAAQLLERRDQLRVQQRETTNEQLTNQ